jgi:hypothetical protein
MSDTGWSVAITTATRCKSSTSRRVPSWPATTPRRRSPPATTAKLNHGECAARLEAPDDSQLTFTEAVARARKLGDPTPGNGWRRLLWRMADLLESEQ